MTIVLKEAARRKITRRKEASNGKPRETSQTPQATKSARPMADFLAGVEALRLRVLARDAGAFDGISGAELVNAGRSERIARIMGDDGD